MSISVDNNPEATVQAAAETQANINIQDIAFLLNIVDVASRRGAFRAEEMSSVGAVYDKVSAFLKSTGVIGEPAEETAPEETE
jgi:hypothetical protein